MPRTFVGTNVAYEKVDLCTLTHERQSAYKLEFDLAGGNRAVICRRRTQLITTCRTPTPAD